MLDVVEVEFKLIQLELDFVSHNNDGRRYKINIFRNNFFLTFSNLRYNHSYLSFKQSKHHLQI